MCQNQSLIPKSWSFLSKEWSHKWLMRHSSKRITCVRQRQSDYPRFINWIFVVSYLDDTIYLNIYIFFIEIRCVSFVFFSLVLRVYVCAMSMLLLSFSIVVLLTRIVSLGSSLVHLHELIIAFGNRCGDDFKSFTYFRSLVLNGTRKWFNHLHMCVCACACARCALSHSTDLNQRLHTQ